MDKPTQARVRFQPREGIQHEADGERGNSSSAFLSAAGVPWLASWQGLRLSKGASWSIVFLFSWLCLHAVCPFGSSARAGDWPMWRYDAGRTAASAEMLADDLQLVWERQGTPRVQAWDDPLNLDLMPYDRVFEPIVLDGRLFVGYNDRDKLVALDVKTGKELWSFFTDAPVRLPPVGWQGRIYFTSDDAHLYCVDAATGKLIWKFLGAPGPRKIIGNQRLTSAWAARGGPVIRDGQVYFAASIWPFMGVFLYALDAETGAIRWVNDSTGASYIKQPHSTPSFAGIGPQGALVATEKYLIVPGGRSVPAVFDRATGALKYFELNAGGKGTGGSFVIANDSAFFVHTRLRGVREFQLATGEKTAFMPNEPVLAGDLVYTGEVANDGRPLVRAYNAQRKIVWEVAADARGDLILAGDKLFAAGPDSLSAIALPNRVVSANEPTATSTSSSPSVVWKVQPRGQIERLLAAHGHLFAVTREGHLQAYAPKTQSESVTLAESPEPLTVTAEAEAVATRLTKAGDPQGYALWFGAADDPILHALAARSPFVQLAVIDQDEARVATARLRFDRAATYGRVTAHVAAHPLLFDAPPYIAHMVFIGADSARTLIEDRAKLAKVYDSVRPYGGTLQILAPTSDRASLTAMIQALGLEQAQVEQTEDGILVRRVGALPGSANWTHLHGDMANTRKSNDARVKLPLGLLWYGGSSNLDVLPRHGHGPPQQVVDGRLFIQGINVLNARDVYTGRVLWKRTFQDLGTFDVYYDATYKETPLDPAYNQVHIPGANARGTNYVVTSDRIYILEGAVCRVLDPATGELLQTIELPQTNPQQPQAWSYIGVYENVLVGGLGFAKYRERLGLSFAEEDGKLSSSKAGFGSKSLDRAGSMALVGFDRHTGQQLWKVDAQFSFWNNAIVAGRGLIYALDKHPKAIEEKLRRRGIAFPQNYRIVALDARTGKPAWEVKEGIFGTWLGYSEKFDCLLQAGAAASDRLSVETDQGMTVYQGQNGSVIWSQPNLRYSGPCILHNDLIITNTNAYSQSAGAFYLQDGKPFLITNPLTGQEEPWKISRAYGCNTILASENLLTFRSGAAGFYDLTTHSGTGNFGGFKSGCTGNLIAAGGVLNAPDYTRTCSCSYQNQTSLALVHMPEIETWTVNLLSQTMTAPQRVDALGINFAAPGHHRGPDGMLWIESPNLVSEIPPIQVTIEGEPRAYRRHSSALSDRDYSWVFASGLEGEFTMRISTVVGRKSASGSKPAVDTGDRSSDPKADPANSPLEKPLPYALRLFFGAPAGGPSPGPRTFDVEIDGVRVLTDLNLADGETLIRELPRLELTEHFQLRLIAKEGQPLISGIELRRLAE